MSKRSSRRNRHRNQAPRALPDSNLSTDVGVMDANELLAEVVQRVLGPGFVWEGYDDIDRERLRSLGFRVEPKGPAGPVIDVDAEPADLEA